MTTMTTQIVPTITGTEFDARHPDGQSWRAAGRPDYGYRANLEAVAASHGWLVGLDYEDHSGQYSQVRAWCYGALDAPAPMTIEEFNANMQAASAMGPTLDAEYWAGYRRGLRRHYHGPAFGTDEEHRQWHALADDVDEARRARGEGYYEGSRGTPAADIIRQWRTS